MEVQRPQEFALRAMPLLVRLLIVVCLVVSCLLAWRWISVVRDQLTTPWDIGWESPNLCSILLIQRHANIYAESTYNSYPFVLTMYTPLYHYVTSLFPIRQSNPFFYGRVVALAACLGLSGLIVLRGRRPLLGGCLAVAFLSTWTASAQSAILHVDALGVLLAVSGMLLVSYSRSWPAILAAGLLAVAAVATKQTLVAATLATGVFLLVNDRHALLRYCAAVGLWAAIGAASTSLCFGSGFWFLTVHAARQPFFLPLGFAVLKSVAVQPLSDVLVLAAVMVICGRLYTNGVKRTLQSSPSSVYFLLAMSVFFATIWKVGSSRHYAFEPLWASCLVLADAISDAGLRWRRGLVAAIAGALCLAGIFDLSCANLSDYRATRCMPAATIGEYQAIIRRTGVNNPRILNTTIPLYIFSVGLEPTFNDSAVYHSMYWRKLLSPRPLIDAITRGEYDVIVLSDGTAAQQGGVEARRDIRAAVMEDYQPFEASANLHSHFFVRAGPRQSH